MRNGLKRERQVFLSAQPLPILRPLIQRVGYCRERVADFTRVGHLALRIPAGGMAGLAGNLM
jgi:hypothetical protein